jgi:hypothetical protein
MKLVARQVRKEPDSTSPDPSPENLSTFRDAFAWVLLGEPGMGKSKALQMEADATQPNSLRIAIDEFIAVEPDTNWQGKTLFLDGLDEVRGNGDRSVLLTTEETELPKISAQLPRCRLVRQH